MSLFVTLDDTIKTALADRFGSFRYWKIVIDPDGTPADISEYIHENSLSGGQGNDYSKWSVTLDNRSCVFTEGDYANQEVAIQAKAGVSDYFTIFTGYTSDAGLSRVVGRIDDDLVTLDMHDLTKTKGTRRKPASSIWSGYKISDPSDTSASIVHKLAGYLGVDSGDVDTGTISDTVTAVAVGKNTAWSELQEVADLFLADLYFRHDGKLRFNSRYVSGYSAPSSEWVFSADPTRDEASGESQVYGKIGKNKTTVLCNKAICNYNEYTALPERVIFQNLDNYTEATDQIEIEIAAGEYYPGGTSSADKAVLSYKDPETGEQYEMADSVNTPTIGATGSDSDIEYTGGTLTLVSFNGSTSATAQQAGASEIILRNTGGATCTITKLTISGRPYRATKQIVEDIDPAVTDEVDYIEKTIKGNYVTTYAQVAASLKATVEFGKARKRQWGFSADWCPGIQKGAVVTLIDTDGTEYTATVESYSHKGFGYNSMQTTVQLLEYGEPTAARVPVRSIGSNPPALETRISIINTAITNAPTYSEIATGYTNDYGTLTPTAPTVTAQGYFRSIILHWDKQDNLRWIKEYEIQVSDDDSTWYSILGDGTDWKATLGEVTTCTGEMFTHPKIPFDGTDDDPEAVTLYYRVRRRTMADTAGDWSSSVSASTNPIGVGDLVADAITAGKISAATLTTILLKASALWLGYTGDLDEEGEIDPTEGDRRIYQDGDEIQFQEYTADDWSTVNSIILGGADSSGNFLPFLGCRGVYNPLGDSPAGQPLPDDKYRLLTFETDYNDQNGDGPTNTSDPVRTTAWSKFGSYSFFTTYAAGDGTLSYEDVIGLASNIGFGCWVYGMVKHTTAAFATAQYEYNVNADNRLLISLVIQDDRLTANVLERVSGSYVQNVSAEIMHDFTTAGEFYIAFGINMSTPELYVVLNNEKETATLSAFTVSGTPTYNRLLITSYYTGTTGEEIISYLDDVVFGYDTTSDPDIYIQHYLSGLPWTTTYSAKDVLLKPADGGVVNLKNAPTSYYSPVSGEDSVGTLHYLYGGTASWTAVTVNPTTWTLLDFSSSVPVGCKLMLVHIQSSPDSSESGLLLAKKYSDSLSVADAQTYHPDYEILRYPTVDTASDHLIPCEDGKAYLADYSASYSLTTLHCKLKGYYI